MAQFEMDLSGLEQLLSRNIALVDEVAPKMLEEGAPILQKTIASNMPSATSHYANKVVLDKPKKAKNGGWVSTINFKGKAKDGTRLMQLMAFWEYGTYISMKERIPKTGFLKKSIAKCQNEVVAKMKEVFNREVGK